MDVENMSEISEEVQRRGLRRRFFVSREGSEGSEGQKRSGALSPCFLRRLRVLRETLSFRKKFSAEDCNDYPLAGRDGGRSTIFIV